MSSMALPPSRRTTLHTLLLTDLRVELLESLRLLVLATGEVHKMPNAEAQSPVGPAADGRSAGAPVGASSLDTYPSDASTFWQLANLPMNLTGNREVNLNICCFNV